MPKTGKPAQKVKSPRSAQENDESRLFNQKRTKLIVQKESNAEQENHEQNDISPNKEERTIIKAKRRFNDTDVSMKNKKTPTHDLLDAKKDK